MPVKARQHSKFSTCRSLARILLSSILLVLLWLIWRAWQDAMYSEAAVLRGLGQAVAKLQQEPTAHVLAALHWQFGSLAAAAAAAAAADSSSHSRSGWRERQTWKTSAHQPWSLPQQQQGLLTAHPQVSPAALKAAASIRWLLQRTHRVLTCEHSAVSGGGSAPFLAPPGPGSVLMVAANLYNSAHVLPNLITQYLALSAALASPPFLSTSQEETASTSTTANASSAAASAPMQASSVPSIPLALSIYESGSSDGTRAWLTVFSDMLMSAGLPATIISNGTLTRGAGSDRIEFLAALRNAALAPALDGRHGAVHSLAFVNDVFFCAGHVLRLARYRSAGATLACGLDFNKVFHDQDVSTSSRQRWMALHLHKVWGVPLRLGAWLAGRRKMYRRWFKLYRHSRSLRRLLPFWFYDTWVARARDGSPFPRPAPHITHTTSAAAMLAGRPFAAYCCWNGLALLDAAPFLGPASDVGGHDGASTVRNNSSGSHRIDGKGIVSSRSTSSSGLDEGGGGGAPSGLRFRAHAHGECSASECSLLCDDLWARGGTRVVVDPAVRVVYDWEDAVQVYDHDMLLHPLLPFSPELVQGVQAQWTEDSTPPHSITCCDLQPGHDAVIFETDCRQYDPGAVNYTRWAVEGTWIRAGVLGAPFSRAETAVGWVDEDRTVIEQPRSTRRQR